MMRFLSPGGTELAKGGALWTGCEVLLVSWGILRLFSASASGGEEFSGLCVDFFQPLWESLGGFLRPWLRHLSASPREKSGEGVPCDGFRERGNYLRAVVMQLTLRFP